MHLLKSSTEPCFICQETDDIVQIKLDGRETPVCWKHVRQLFKSRHPKEKQNGNQPGNTPAANAAAGRS
jgi:hypothetical protein